MYQCVMFCSKIILNIETNLSIYVSIFFYNRALYIHAYHKYYFHFDNKSIN